MKKREIIKQKKKQKQIQSIKYLKLSYYACVFLILMFLVYVGGISLLLQKPFEELLQRDPIVIVGFIICTANLYIRYVLKNVINDIQNCVHIESIRINLILLTVGQFVLMNYLSAILMVLSLKNYFEWDSFSFHNAFIQIKKENQLVVCIVTCIVLTICIALVFGIYFAIKQ